MAEDPVICKFYLVGQCRFGDSCRNSHDAEVPVLPSRKPKKSKVKAAAGKEEKDGSSIAKLPSMKTARDVIQRILWDEEVPSQHITVGYLDRFVGVLEQPFDTFDWTSDLASVDHQTVLAIPQHRIQFFKYRGRKLWDKNERLDLVFGSTSRQDRTEMTSLLRGIDDELLFGEDLLANADAGTSELEESPDSAPTHFLAIRIDEAKLLAALQNTVTDLVAVSGPVKGRVPSELYHCTLALLTLDTVDQVSHCASLLKSLGPELARECPEFLLLKGLSTFRERVLFARVQPDPKLDGVVTSLAGLLRRQGVQVVDRPQQFHVSLVKGSKHVGGLDKSEIAQNEKLFGQQPIGFVHLCSVREAPDVDGFYRVVTSVKIPERKPSEVQS